ICRVTKAFRESSKRPEGVENVDDEQKGLDGETAERPSLHLQFLAQPIRATSLVLSEELVGAALRPAAEGQPAAAAATEPALPVQPGLLPALPGRPAHAGAETPAKARSTAADVEDSGLKEASFPRRWSGTRSGPPRRGRDRPDPDTATARSFS